jgi:simple sugar transport system substrate-binding protein
MSIYKISLMMLLIFMLFGCAKSSESQKLSIEFFAGGTADFYFSQRIADGAQYAADLLDCDLHILWSDWNNETMLLQFKEAIDRRPDGIAIMGHPGSDAMRPLVSEARRKGIIVTSLNVDLVELENTYKNEGFGYSGQLIRESSEDLAYAVLRNYDLRPGDTILVHGVETIPIRGLRTTAGRKVFEDAGLKVIYIEHSSGDNSEEREKKDALSIQQALESNPTIKLIFDDTAVLTSGKLVKDLGYDADDIVVVGFDLSAEVVPLIQEGYIDIVSDQQPWLQGFFPVIQIFLTKNYDFSGLTIDTGGRLITAGNIDLIAKYVLEGVR